MEIKRAGTRAVLQGQSDSFTGAVRIEPLLDTPSPGRVHASSVSFEPGSRTHWHTHPLGQTLVIISGLGWAQIEGQEKEELRPGDVVWIPPNTRHWHGATDSYEMTHMAIQEDENGKAVEWQEAVTDEQYNNLAQEKGGDTIIVNA